MQLSELDSLEASVESLLAHEPLPRPERIRELIDRHRVLFTITDDEAEQLARRLEARHGVSMTIGTVLTFPEWAPWLESAKTGIEPYYWERYRRLLVQKHLSGHVVASLDEVTDRILGLMENPAKSGDWGRRGLVVGHVQSGKTANYTGLICKAADAGYRVVIVIAGIHNNLRNQTQHRIDEGFVGRDSAKLLSSRDDVWIGAGLYDKSRRPVTFTSSLKDFNKSLATSIGIPMQNLSEPAVFVIKKNASTLKYLIEWLRDHSAKLGSAKIEAPMLLIDDEADNASINIRHGKGEVACINGRIRELLSLFERNCYVGYTATPFANIFIDPDSTTEMLGDDLFPRHFIVSLDPPSDYFGPVKVFVDQPERFIRHICDNEDLLPLKHQKSHEIAGLPRSLHEAVRAFVVASAIRCARGHARVHCSMLINASRFTDVQRQLRNEVHGALDRVRDSARLYGALPEAKALQDPEMAALRAVWATEFADCGFEWSEIQRWLNEAAAPIKVVEVNSRSAGALDYEKYADTGLKVIAVGGYSLSRGLTLEGLMISYYLRNSVMYDTLMQMGRWFGYRPEYEDLCRIWMPEEAEGWYAHVAESMEMLRDELREMEKAGASPEQFGLKVRSHPDTLLVTAREKMGSGEKLVVSIGLDKSFVETSKLHRDMDIVASNLRAADAFVASLAEHGCAVSSANLGPGGWLLRDAPVAPVLEFLSAFQNHPLSTLTDSGLVRRYIVDRAEGELAAWNVLFASVGPQRDAVEDSRLGIPIRRQYRTPGKNSDLHLLLITDKQRVASRGVERVGVDPEKAAEAEGAYLARNPGSKNLPDYIYRGVRDKPLLIIHLLDVTPVRDGKSEGNPVLAWSISFPKTAKPEQTVEYVVNTTWLRDYYRDELDDEEMEGDLD